MYRSKSRKPLTKVAQIPPTGIKVWPDSAPCTEEQRAKQVWRNKQRRVRIGLPGHRIVTIGQLLVAAIAIWGTLLLLFLAWWRPYLGTTSGATGFGLFAGILYSYLYFRNCKTKLQNQQVLSMDPGLKGCQFLLGTLPSWISLTEREKMEVKLTGGKDNNKETFTTATIAKNANPRWSQNNKFTLYDVNSQDHLVLNVYEPSLGIDTDLGSRSIAVADIIASRQVSRWTGELHAGYVYDQFSLHGSTSGSIELEIEFLPYW